jgi:methylmalonyl-CoA mutase cobalamin-binding subunit
MDGAFEDYLSNTGFEVIMDGKHVSHEEIINTDYARS